MRVLIIDDEASIREFVSKWIAHLGHEVETAPDGAVGLEKTRADPRYDVVLVDWTMPRMDGPTFCRQLCLEQGEARPHIIMFTALSDPQRSREGLSAGADDFLAKPVLGDVLKNRLLVAEKSVQTRAKLAAATARVVELEAMLARAERTDPLSGFGNRLALNEALPTLATAGGAPRVFAMLDLDGFVAVNSDLGPQAGDDYLAALSGLMREALVGAECAFRIGDDRFLLVLDGDDAEARLEAMRGHVAQLGLTNNGQGEWRLTATLSGLRVPAGRTVDAWKLMGLLDELLMVGKAAGGDLVKVESVPAAALLASVPREHSEQTIETALATASEGGAPLPVEALGSDDERF